MDLNIPLTALYGVGQKNQKLLNKLSLTTCEDLLYYFPARYEDYSNIKLIKDLTVQETVTVKAKLEEISSTRSPRRRIFLTQAVFSDNSGELEITWFNQPYLKNTLKIGQWYWLSGQAKTLKPEITFEVKEYEALRQKQIHTGRIIPVYNLTRGLTNKWLRLWTSNCLELSQKIKEFLPASLMKNLELMDLGLALKQIHFPGSKAQLLNAQNRLAFNEMFLAQLHHQQTRSQWQTSKAQPIPFDLKLTKKIINQLDFKLTNAQRKASWQIIQDLEKKQPMNRLLEGDVGSGKTLVAILALAQTAQAGLESSLMAPTKLLASQHHKTISKILKPLGFKTKLVSNESKIQNSKPKAQNTIYIGTHALIQDKFKFNNLALAVIDEQHRFGVKQRAKLIAKSGDKTTAPHLLSMTATPIPRTLALTAFGDLDLSILDEMPKGRKTITTKIVNPLDRDQTYEFIRRRLKQKQQAFVIYPLVNDSNKIAIRSATSEYERLKTDIFPEFELGLVHGSLAIKERDETVAKFRDGQISLLVSTAVVEVGIDIPGATMMIIEHAERFGLAQLHQFRGRIGRNNQSAFCFLFTESRNDSTQKRLQALINCQDGFALAKKDLAIRGPGQVFGTSQSGWPEFKMANIFDYALTLKARDSAKTYFPKLNDFPLLKAKLAEFEKEIHFE